MITRYCNYCGKQIDNKDDYQHHHIYIPMWYGSKYDGDDVQADLCLECTDKLIDFLRPLCKYDPVVPSGTDDD